MKTQEKALAVIGETRPRSLAIDLQEASKAIIPKTLDDMIRLSKFMAQSGLIPKEYQGKPENVFIAIQMGMEVGLSATQAVQNIAAIGGRPCVFGDAALALVQSSGLLESIEEYDQGRATQEKAGYCRVKRKGDSYPHEVWFTQDQAKTAGLWGKAGPWTNYPGRMLQLRARAFALRDKFPDVLKGLHVREEVEDIEMLRDKIGTYTPKRIDEPQTETSGYVAVSEEKNVSHETGFEPTHNSAGAPANEPPPFDAPLEKISKEQHDTLIGLVRHDDALMARLNARLAASGFKSTTDITVDKYAAILKWAEEKSGV